MGLLSEYLETLVPLTIGLVALVAILTAALRRAGLRPTTVLTPLEWRCLYQVFAILFFALVLLQADISFELDAEQFIYGRF